MNKRKGKNTPKIEAKPEIKPVSAQPQTQQTHKRRIRTELLPKEVLLRVDEVAHYFDVSERTVYLWIEHGHLEVKYTPGGQKRITKESVERCKLGKKHWV